MSEITAESRAQVVISIQLCNMWCHEICNWDVVFWQPPVLLKISLVFQDAMLRVVYTIFS